MFENDLKVMLKHNRGKYWELLEDLRYNDEVMGLIIVPKGTRTDFSSVPRIPVVFELVGDKGHAAAVVHDFLYHSTIFTRAQSDAVFHRALGCTGTGKTRSTLMYLGVRLFGKSSYGKFKE